MKTIKWLQFCGRGSRKPALQQPAVSCSFEDGETVIYGDDKVEIMGIWKDWATIKFDDGETINVGIEELQKVGLNCN